MSHTYIEKYIFNGYSYIYHLECPLALCNKSMFTGMACLTMHPLASL